jgi:hypothetical protein
MAKNFLELAFGTPAEEEVERSRLLAELSEMHRIEEASLGFGAAATATRTRPASLTTITRGRGAAAARRG